MPAVKFLAMPFADLRRKLDQSLIYDWAMRFPLVIFSSFILFRDVLAFCQQVVHNPALFEHFNGAVVIAMLAQISQWMFVLLLSILPLFRLRPIAKSDEILPRVVPLIVTCVPPMFMLLERAPPDLAFNVPAVIVILLANVMAVATVSFLGRSLSLMPEAGAWCGSVPMESSVTRCICARCWALVVSPYNIARLRRPVCCCW